MVREGEKVIELPPIQAVSRSMGVAAMKGNQFAQKTLTEMVAKLEVEHFASRLELFETMFEYKRTWDQEIDRCRKLGIPEPEPIPHPDDIVLDPNTGSVQVRGPRPRNRSSGSTRRWRAAQRRRRRSPTSRASIAGRRDPALKAQYLEEWHWEQRMFNIINDVVGPRYKARLMNRTYARGASREGEAIEEFRKRQALRREYFG